METTKGHEKLKTWMRENNVNNFQLSKLLKVNSGTVHFWFKRSSTPRGNAMDSIEALTNGFVTMKDFNGDYDAKTNTTQEEKTKQPSNVTFNQLYFSQDIKCNGCVFGPIECGKSQKNLLSMLFEGGLLCENQNGGYNLKYTWKQSTPENTTIGDTVRRKENKNMVFDVIAKLDGSIKYQNMIVVVGDDGDEKFVKCENFEVRVDI